MNTFKCVIHGSFLKHFDLIQAASKTFRDAGIEVLAPSTAEITDYKDGFGLFADEVNIDPRLIELQYLQKLKQLGENGFSFFVSPKGYIGKSTSYELGIAQLTNTRCFFTNKLSDHPAYTHGRSIWSAESLVDYIQTYDQLPSPSIRPNEQHIHALWQDLMVPGSVVATGAIIEYASRNIQDEKEVLLVKTHKWGNRYSIVGGKVNRNERLKQALLREVKEETGLGGEVGQHICTFDQIKNSGYYQTGIQHIFVDNVVSVSSKNVKLNEEAQDYIWALPSEALSHLDIEPNARETLELYTKLI